MLKMPEYHQLPLSGRIVLKTGEVAEFRARLIKKAEDVTIIEDAYFIIDGELVGPFNLDGYRDLPKDKLNYQKAYIGQ